ncbi:MAG TPA: hypothetical protein VEG44_02820 [Candidatus Acidoferrales bacterium]|nr:hypothetical protein [Candidatus Acidoferrales bacterium]
MKALLWLCIGGEDTIKLANLLDLMPIEGYGNVKFAIAKSSGIFDGVKEVDGMRVVSNVQLMPIYLIILLVEKKRQMKYVN